MGSTENEDFQNMVSCESATTNVSVRKSKKKKRKKLNSNKQEISATFSEEDRNNDNNSEEEGLDPNSAFCANVRNKLTGSKKIDKQTKQQNPSNLPPQCYIYGIEGYRKACDQQFKEAIDLYTKAIALEPKEWRFFGNRAFCYVKTLQYNLALKDADEAISLNPEWAKGYYRKAEALIGLKKFKEAEEYFHIVLQHEPTCGDAVEELYKVQARQIIEVGFQQDEAIEALREFGNVELALNYLLEKSFEKAALTRKKPSSQNQRASSNPSLPPSLTKNTTGTTSLWIGNVCKEFGEEEVRKMFSEYGHLSSVRVLYDRNCAFVNYKDSTSPEKAMTALQGMHVKGKNLVIRYRNNN